MSEENQAVQPQKSARGLKYQINKSRKFNGQIVNHRHVVVELMLYIHGKQLRSCPDGQLIIHTVPGQASPRQVTSTCT